MKRAVYAGSFDPPTNGHLFMIQAGARLFDDLVVAIGVHPSKHAAFPLDQRLDLLRAVTSDLPNVRVDAYENQYLAAYAAGIGAGYILRGLRNTSDFESERVMRHLSEDLAPDVTSVFVMPPRGLTEVSSSSVKALIGPQGWQNVVRGMVPASVFEALVSRYPEASTASNP